MMSSLGFKRDSKYLQRKRIDGARHWSYVISYDELYTLFDKKGWIHSRDKEDYGIDNEADGSQKIDEAPVSKPEPVPKKTPPPVPSKPDHLKVSDKPLNTEGESQQPVPSASKDENHVVEFLNSILSSESANEPEPYGISGPSGTSDEPISKDEQEKVKCQPSSKQSDPLAESILKKNKKGK
jgi:hypothetical protein